MRSVRNLVVLVVLCLAMGATAVSAAEGRPSVAAGREVSGMARILGHLQAFLKAVWENEGSDIDPWGRNVQGNGGATQEDPANPGADEGIHIDPWG